MTGHVPGNPLAQKFAWPFGDPLKGEAFLARAGGWNVSDVLTITGSPNGAQTENLFEVEGAVEVLQLFGHFHDVTDVSAITAAHLDIYDGASTDLTLAAGTDLSGVIVNSMIGRTGAATSALTLLDSANASIIDGAVGLDLFAPFAANAKEGTKTYIRFCYTSDGGGCEAVIHFNIIYRHLLDDAGSNITAAT